MKLSIDPEADALYLKLKEGKVASTQEVADGIILDLDDAGKLLGMEVLWLSERVKPEALASLAIELPIKSE